MNNASSISFSFSNRFLSLFGRMFCLAFALGSTCLAQEWPAWGGSDPGRNLYSTARDLPSEVNPGALDPISGNVDLQQSRNVKWAARLGTRAGNVVVSGGKVFVGTNNGTPRDPRIREERGILMAFEEKTGRFLWQLVVPRLKSGKVNDDPELGLMAAPAVEGNRLYIVTSRCEVLCLDTEGMANGNDGPFQKESAYIAKDTSRDPLPTTPEDADILWKYDIIDELGVFPHNFSNSSILISGDLLFLCTSNGQDWTEINIPSPNSPNLIALDKNSGLLAAEETLRGLRPIGPRILHGQWSSPSMATVDGRPLVFLGAGDGWCYGFDTHRVLDAFETYYLTNVFRADINPSEYRTNNGKAIPYRSTNGPSEIIATPVFWKDRLYVATGQLLENGDGAGHLACINPALSGDITQSGLVWSYKGIGRTVSTVSITPDGLLFAADNAGILHCLEATTGELLWKHSFRAGSTQKFLQGSPFGADGKIYLGDEQGDLMIFAATREKQLLSETRFPSPILSTPIAANGVLYVATSTHLYALQEPTHLHIQNLNGKTSISWRPRIGTLQESSSVEGPWRNLPNATSPREIEPNATAAFYRVISD